LVFSTLHTNDAPGAVTRMTNMGVEPFLITSTVHCVVAQRLIRKICSECKKPYEASHELIQDLGLASGSQPQILYKGEGCSNCSSTGYRGRLAIHELLPLNEEFKKGVIQKKSTADLKMIARKAGMQTLRECGIQKVLKGMTTVEELLRVAHEDESE
jgi:type IV pilus assembly protein PilB